MKDLQVKDYTWGAKGVRKEDFAAKNAFSSKEKALEEKGEKTRA